MTSVALSGVTKAFSATRAVGDVDLTIDSGAFLALLGPSGCGKTTLLRLIAGLERPDAGRIAFDGEEMAAPGRFVEPEDRRLGMVFQSYALWPTMTVAGNVAFGLGVRGVPRAERDRIVSMALGTVGLSGLGARKPAQLSGGQRQRAALARCLALSPKLILLDEPLANLDAHLRAAMIEEFRRIHRDSRASFIFVTHDQSEAMALADQVAVMNEGRIEQIGTPETLYEKPATEMVARFIGEGAVLPVEVRRDEGTGEGLFMRIEGHAVPAPSASAPGRYHACIRPEDVRLLDPADGEGLAARVVSCVYRGGYYALQCCLSEGLGTTLTVHADRRAAPGDRINLGIGKAWLVSAGRAA